MNFTKLLKKQNRLERDIVLVIIYLLSLWTYCILDTGHWGGMPVQSSAVTRIIQEY